MKSMNFTVDQLLKNSEYAKREKEKREHRNAIVLKTSKKKRRKDEDNEEDLENGRQGTD